MYTFTSLNIKFVLVCNYGANLRGIFLENKTMDEIIGCNLTFNIIYTAKSTCLFENKLPVCMVRTIVTMLVLVSLELPGPYCSRFVQT